MTELLKRINRHLEFLMDCAIEPRSIRIPTQKLIDEINAITNKPISNADRIRQMTDEELCDFLDGFLCYKIDVCRAEDIECRDCKMEWLKQEAKEGDSDA